LSQLVRGVWSVIFVVMLAGCGDDGGEAPEAGTAADSTAAADRAPGAGRRGDGRGLTEEQRAARRAGRAERGGGPDPGQLTDEQRAARRAAWAERGGRPGMSDDERAARIARRGEGGTEGGSAPSDRPHGEYGGPGGATKGEAAKGEGAKEGDKRQSESGKKSASAERGGRQAGGRGRGSQRDSRFQNRPVPVAVALVERGRIDAFYATTTSLEAEQEASVVARTQGIVEEIFVEEGDQVKAKDALAQLDTRRLALEVARTRTNIASLTRAFDRAKSLIKTKMISPELYDKAQFDFEREQATLALQLHDLEEATIRAPINGRITKRHIKIGNTLSPNASAFEIKRARIIEAVLNVPEKELPKMQVGQYARLRVDALGNRTFEGIVERIAPEVDAQSGTFRVTVSIDNAQDNLKPGMFARVSVRYDSNENTLLIARDAVVVQRNESTVFVVSGGKAKKQQVITGYTMEGRIEILEGLTEGDEIVITGQGGLREGSPVRVVAN
jgi:membrane fusion protein (multidrug efflux system)